MVSLKDLRGLTGLDYRPRLEWTWALYWAILHRTGDLG